LRDASSYHKSNEQSNKEDDFRPALQFQSATATYSKLTGRNLTVFGALRLLFPSLATLSIGPTVALWKEIDMPIGTVKFFNSSKGYGFIQPDDGSKDAFVHISAVENSGMSMLSENQRISYDLEEDRRGKMSAVNLKAAEDNAGSGQAAEQPSGQESPAPQGS
jgi:CspA family cold shock protein